MRRAAVEASALLLSPDARTDATRMSSDRTGPTAPRPHALAGEPWSFPPASEGGRHRQVRIRPRLSLNSVEAAIASAVEGRGLVRVLCYQVADEVRSGGLALVLKDCEPPLLPVHLVAPEGRLSVAKVRAFADFALPRLKARFAESVE